VVLLVDVALFFCRSAPPAELNTGHSTTTLLFREAYCGHKCQQYCSQRIEERVETRHQNAESYHAIAQGC